MENNKFDLKAVLAIGLGLFIWLGWQLYLNKKYPKANAAAVSTATPNTPDLAAKSTSEQNKDPNLVTSKETSKPINAPAKTFEYETDSVKFTLSSLGMGISNYSLKDYKDHSGHDILMSNGTSSDDGLFAMKLPQVGLLPFEVAEKGPGYFVGTARVGGLTISRELKFHSDTRSFESRISFSGADDSFRNGFSLIIPGKLDEQKKSSFLMPSYDHQDFVVSHLEKTETIMLSNRKESLSEERKTSRLVSFGSQYFAVASLDKSELLPDVKLIADVNSRKTLAEINYKPLQIRPDMQFSQVFYAGPKSVEKLRGIDPELPSLVDFGWLGFIASPLVKLLRVLFDLVGNWGWAIVLLTLVVRLFVLPFNIMSTRSMKAMQRIQPQMQALRERYKEDPMTLNKEMMTLMKESGANPFGGCLPMLLQIPIFFALYRVIGSSVELYQSPFFGWITDLSAHDRFYVFPVLMGIAMFLQQKMTPTTMDPAQAKIFAFMPLIFTVFMLQLPSGLTVYMLVSAVFGIIQQYIMLRDAKKA